MAFANTIMTTARASVHMPSRKSEALIIKFLDWKCFSNPLLLAFRIARIDDIIMSSHGAFMMEVYEVRIEAWQEIRKYVSNIVL